jgi:hypothetical protein
LREAARNLAHGDLHVVVCFSQVITVRGQDAHTELD